MSNIIFYQPSMTCDKCGLMKVVTKSPEATQKWFNKYHKECGGKPQYRAGIGPFPRLTGQKQ